MSLILTTVNDVFFQPLKGLAAASPNARPCPDFSDHEFLHLGIQRVLQSSESGRAFLQEHGVRFQNALALGNYFAALKSKRRGLAIKDVNLALLVSANAVLHDRLAGIPELVGYECFAQDGHWPRMRGCGSRSPA